jgi:hypothetical protein
MLPWSDTADSDARRLLPTFTELIESSKRGTATA